MPEWSIGPHSKCGVRATVPGVRIPPSPLKIDRRLMKISRLFFVCVCRCASPRPRQTKITSLRLSVDFQHRARDSELRKGVARIVLYLLLDLKICAEKESSRVRAEARPSNPSLSAKTNEAKRCRGIDTFLCFIPLRAKFIWQRSGVKRKSS